MPASFGIVGAFGQRLSGSVLMLVARLLSYALEGTYLAY